MFQSSCPLPLTACVGLSLLCAASSCGPDDANLEAANGARRTGVLLIGSGPVIQYEEVEGEYVFEGDIAVPPSMVKPLHDTGPADELGMTEDALLSTASPSRLWPNGVVPYTISSSLSSTMKSRIQAAIDSWNSRTVVKFVPRNGESDYVTFRPSPATYAYASLGRVGGQQFVNLVSNPTGVVIHEMGHSLGFIHEHTRPDRDSHVTIHWGNIRAGMEGNFSIYSSGKQVGAYDIDSIMHYPSYEFSANGNPTITRKNGSTYPQNYNSLSAGDIAATAQLYGAGIPGEIIVDSNASLNVASKAKITVPSDAWISATTTSGYYGTGYWHAETRPFMKTFDPVVFSFHLDQPAVKKVEAWWTAGTNRSPAAPFTVVSSSGAVLDTVQVDQRSQGGQWNELGTWSFPAGWNEVRVGRTAPREVVIADAIRIRDP